MAIRLLALHITVLEHEVNWQNLDFYPQFYTVTFFIPMTLDCLGTYNQNQGNVCENKINC